MSYLQKLLDKYCPDGYEWVKLEDAVDYIQPTKYIEKVKVFENEGIPVLTPGKQFILGYTKTKENIFQASKQKPVILFDDFTTSFKLVNFPFKVRSSACKILTSRNNEFSIMFTYYFMQTINYEIDQHARQWISNYSQILIPKIPLKIQEKIVEILERFRILEAELKAELEARRKQFDFISNNLLMPKTKNIKWINLSEKFEFVRGLNYKLESEKFVSDIKPVHVLRANNIELEMNSLNLNDVKKVFLKNIDKKYILSKNDILISISSGSKKHVGKLFFSSKNTDYYFGGFMAAIRKINKDYNSKYLYYLLNSKIFKKYLEVQLNTSTINNINNQIIYNFKIPAISLETQNKIVSILDKLSEYSQEINLGLPAEIELRSKQFKYYRDQLLDFK